MTSSLDSEMSWISLQELQEPKWCSQCHQLLSVKQINFTEACRTCFNAKCSSTADIEYIRRSYRDMESETSDQDLNEPSGILDEEEVNELLNQVENLVAHRLTEELKNELKSCREKPREVLPSESMKEPVDCDESEKLSKDFSSDLSLSQSLCTDFQPQPCTTSSCVSSQFVGPVSQFKENAAPWYEGTLGCQSETCDNLISSHDVLPVPVPFDLNGKVSPVSPTAYDNPPDDPWQCDAFLPNNCGSECLDLKPDHVTLNSEEPSDRPDSALDSKKPDHVAINSEEPSDRPDSALDSKIPDHITINSEEPSDRPDSALDSKKPDHVTINSEEPSDRPDSALDSKASLPLSNDELILPGGCLNSDSNIDESGEKKSCENDSIVPPKSGDPSCFAVPSGREQQDFSKDNEATVEQLQSDQDFDLSIKKTSSFRCYRPKRGRGRQRAFTQETPMKLPVYENVLIDTTSATSELSSFNPFCVDESSKESDVQLFPTPSASPDSCQSFPEPFEHLSHPPFSQSKGDDFVDEGNFTQKPRPLHIQVQLGDDGEVILDEVKSTDNGRGSLSNCMLSDIVIKKERGVSAPKKSPTKAEAKTATVPKIETGLVKGAGSNSGLGFSELKQFGGAKCSAPPRGVRTRGGRLIGRGRRRVKSRGKLASSPASSPVHDDIEQAIANIQQSSESQPSLWNSFLSDILL